MSHRVLTPRHLVLFATLCSTHCVVLYVLYDSPQILLFLFILTGNLLPTFPICIKLQSSSEIFVFHLDQAMASELSLAQRIKTANLVSPITPAKTTASGLYTFSFYRLAVSLFPGKKTNNSISQNVELFL